MVKVGLLLAMVPLCCFAGEPKKVVITEKASQMARALSDISSTTRFNDAPDWEKDYIVPSQDTARLKGLKLRVNILDKSGRLTHKYTTYISAFQGSLRISVRPIDVNKEWSAHELGNVHTFVIVGESGKLR